jgi:hypothetical protein
MITAHLSSYKKYIFQVPIIDRSLTEHSICFYENTGIQLTWVRTILCSWPDVERRVVTLWTGGENREVLQDEGVRICSETGMAARA